jgi:superfamily II DNA or RNA helicase
MPEWLTQEDREEAIEVLKRHLTPAQMRKVGDREIERLVAITENAGGLHRVQVANDDLAGFLIDLRGTELLKEREIRWELVNKLPDEHLTVLASWRGEIPAKTRNGRIDQIAGRKWKPGGPWPRYFASFLGFTKVFAGIAGSPESQPEEIVEARIPLPDLHDYQKELVEKVYTLLAAHAGENRAILSLPTGAGKTRTAVEALLTAWNKTEESKPYILWIAQSSSLCAIQAAEAFREVWVDRGGNGPRKLLHLFRYWGSRNVLPDVFGDGVIIASIQKLNDTLQDEQDRGELERIAQETFAVVIDEAHHAIAPSYLTVLEFLGVRSERDGNASTPLLGLTATPYRGKSTEENRRLANLFSNKRLTAAVLGKNPLQTLRQRGILSSVQHQFLETRSTFALNDEELRRYKQFDRLPESFLRRVGADQKRNALLLKTLQELPKDWPVLFFGCSLEHAGAFTALLRRKERSAALITGETRKATRRHMIEEFREGHVQFLCNYGVLTTGFDAPKIRAIVIARPTTSVVLYEQMIGRGMRGPHNGGTEECLVVDLADNIQRFEGQMAYGRFEEYWQ